MAAPGCQQASQWDAVSLPAAFGDFMKATRALLSLGVIAYAQYLCNRSDAVHLLCPDDGEILISPLKGVSFQTLKVKRGVGAGPAASF